MSSESSKPSGRPTDQQTLATLFDLGRQVTSVLDLDALLRRIPDLIRRLVQFEALAIFLLDDRKSELRIAYGVGYPEGAAGEVHLKVGEGLVGAAVERREPVISNDLEHEGRYVKVVPGMVSTVVVPLVFKNRPIGALNILSSTPDHYDRQDAEILAQFGVHVAVALANARSFDRERRDADTFGMLAEIGRDISAILDLDSLLERIGKLARKVIDYRTLGILLLDADTGELQVRLGLRFGSRVDDLPRVRLGDGIVGYAALHRTPVNVPDVSQDPRYIRVLDDVRSELAVPMLLKDRCVGVIDLESPELNAFERRDVEVLTVLASQAAVALENARLYEAVRQNEARLDKEVRFAQRVQAALLPTELPKRLRGVDVAARFSPAHELGGDFYDFLSPEAHSLVVGLGDVSGKGVPAALYSAFASELVRSRTFRRRYTPDRASPGAILASINTILYQRQLEAYFCTLCYAAFDLKRRAVVIANSGLPFPVRVTGGRPAPVEIAGVPLGAFDGTTYDEVTFPLNEGDVFVFCSDGILEAATAEGDEFGTGRLEQVVAAARHRPARAIVDAVFDAAEAHRGDAPQADDMTAVVVKMSS
jgi:sigma-B regulation protein RsbU (phosphoserine phosphatase)